MSDITATEAAPENAALIRTYAPYAALVVALTATLGSLYFSEVRGFIPCDLCWFQRIFMYPLTLITLMGVIQQDELLPNYVLPISIIGFGIAAYHVAMQFGYVPATSCTTVSCSARYVQFFGFMTIPVMSLTAFTLINAVMITMKLSDR